MNTTNKTAIDALPIYEFSAFEDGNKQEYFLRDDVLAALAPTVQEAEPAQGMPSEEAAALIEILTALRPKHGAVGSRDVDVTAQQKLVDAAIAILAAPTPQAAPTVQGSVGESAEFVRVLQKHGVSRAAEFDLIDFIDKFAQRAAVAELAAENYRWLRDVGYEGKPFVMLDGRWYGGSNGVGFDLDKGIAAAMANAAPTASTPPAPEFTDEDKREQEYFDRWPDSTPPAHIEPIDTSGERVENQAGNVHVGTPPAPAEKGQYLTDQQLANLRARTIAETVEKFAAASPLMQVALSEAQQDEKEALTDLRKAVEDGATDAWLLGFVRQYPFAPVPPAVAPEQSVQVSQGVPNDLVPLLKFYAVDTLEALARIQEQHIARLQAKLPSLNQPAFTRVREG